MRNDQHIHPEYLFEDLTGVQDDHELDDAVVAVGLVADVDEDGFEFGELEFVVFVADCAFAEVLEDFGVGQVFLALWVVSAQHD